ncbi:hypothetical protein [Gordonia sp. 'Campus']|uniref:hypothetical protein n=1 Tax=Gordonia sp. 'Campus' TaxID=2915824 RepID=UPI001EE48E15|nr:hypothetical protein [Gordonia sp. 'Campus']
MNGAQTHDDTDDTCGAYDAGRTDTIGADDDTSAASHAGRAGAGTGASRRIADSVRSLRHPAVRGVGHRHHLAY